MTLYFKRMVSIACFSLAVHATGSDYGEWGIIDIPTARMSSDGALRATISLQDTLSSYALTYQATPWLETTFRYSGFKEFQHCDRNYGVKALLNNESAYIPAVAIGIRDAFGTGIFASEYIVATKKIGNIDLSAGIGFGRLAGNGHVDNPLASLSDSFKFRDNDFELGGKPTYKDWFSGEQVAFFGGAVYSFPGSKFDFSVEYNPDQYIWEQGRGGSKPKSPFSFGMNWRYSDQTTLALTNQHGSEWGLRVAIEFDTKSSPKKLPTPKREATANAQAPSSWYQALNTDLKHSGIKLVSASTDKNGLNSRLLIENNRYPMSMDAYVKALKLASLRAPESVKKIDIGIQEQGHNVLTVSSPKLEPGMTTKEIRRAIKIEPASVFYPEFAAEDKADEKINVDISASVRSILFDPNNPFAFGVNAAATVDYKLPKGHMLRGQFIYRLYDNFDDSGDDPSDSVLPHVRSDNSLYANTNDTELTHLYIENRYTAKRNLHVRYFAGMLEQMFAGAGAELLYMKHDSRIAFGASAAWVKQRDFEGGFGFQDYNVATGFLSAYWATPFYNYDAAVHVGRYLAKDVGATVELRRTFDNGWMIGLWATLTDVSSEDFGEGSFDKGFFLRIPLGALFGSNSRETRGLLLRPVQRDGGQRLEDFSGNIWFDLRQTRFDAYSTQKERM